MSNNSRFTDVMNAARTREQEAQQPEGGAVQGQPVLPANVPVPQRPAPAKRGRPATGKRNDPNYEQVAAYIPKDLNKRVKMRLLETNRPREFSELVEFLLNKWLQSGS
jgi:hypothetical protein